MGGLYVGAVVLRMCVGYRFGWPKGNPINALWELLVSGGPLDQAPAVDVMHVRMFKALSATFVGVGLASSGVALQVLLRNPLAEPFILGLSSGAAVGVMAVELGSRWLEQPIVPTHLGALAGGVLSMWIVYAASRRRGVLSPLGLLLVGVVLGTINGAIILTLNYFSGATGMQADISRWMMGYLSESVGSGTLVVSGGVIVCGLVLLVALGPTLDVATFSDAEAHSLGVRLPTLRLLLFVTASGLAACAVVLAGPISFVGLISPHMARLIVGPRHRGMLAAAALIGAMLILLADTTSAALDFGQGLMPLGIFTAILGGPVFIWMLRSRMTGPMDT